MATLQIVPGTPYHQHLLRIFVAQYEQDERVLAIVVYGSLGRGAEDEYSDLDIGVILADDARIEVSHEIAQLSEAYTLAEERPCFTEVAGDSGFIVLPSLMSLDISYFTLDATHPTIVGGFIALTGSLEKEVILEKARARDREPLSLQQYLHKALWHLLTVDKYLQRQHFWRALESLESARTTLFDVYAVTHGGRRAHQIFEEQATLEMREKFGQTLPQYVPNSVRASLQAAGQALRALLDVLENHLETLSNKQATLGDGELALILRLQERQTTRDHT